METNEHFLIECKGYDEIWKNEFPNSNIRENGLKVLLDEDKPPPIKRKICEAIRKSFILKKIKTYE